MLKRLIGHNLRASILLYGQIMMTGAKYAKNVGNKLLEIGIASLAVLEIPRGKPKKWVAADCVEEGINVEKFLALTTCINLFATDILNTRFVGFPARQYLSDRSPILTPSGLLVFAGAPKVGKSDFLISWLFHLAAGVSFLDMIPKRHLRIFYLQTEIGYHYMRERTQLKLSDELIELSADNLVITPQDAFKRR